MSKFIFLGASSLFLVSSSAVAILTKDYWMPKNKLEKNEEILNRSKRSLNEENAKTTDVLDIDRDSINEDTYYKMGWGIETFDIKDSDLV